MSVYYPERAAAYALLTEYNESIKSDPARSGR
jgi:hypothetical protein